jgi:hypothetical protein
MADDKVIREQLAALLRGGNGHMTFEDAIAEFPMKAINRKPPNFNYSFWHLLEHMRVVQWDILEFVRDPGHVSPEYPAGYWPPENAAAGPSEWKKSVRAFRSDLKAVESLVMARETNFFEPIPHAKGYNVFREVLLVADHNAYHIGEILTLRQVMDISPAEKW